MDAIRSLVAPAVDQHVVFNSIQCFYFAVIRKGNQKGKEQKCKKGRQADDSSKHGTNGVRL